MKKTNVCIVGAGPAGLTASLFLSQAGIEHVLLDREKFPRDKVCGESFDGKVFHLLKQLNPNWLEELETTKKVEKCWSYSLTNSWGHKLTVRFPQHHTPKLHIKRKDFDTFLMKKALQRPPAQIFQQTKVTQIQLQKDGVRVSTSQEDIHAQLLILSSGATALIGKDPVKNKGGKATFLFARAYLKGIPPLNILPELEIYFIRRPFKGCLLLCPMAQGEMNVEIGMERREWKRHSKKPDQLFWEATEAAGLLPRLQAATISSPLKSTFMDLSTRPRNYSSERILLAGSVAGSVNPVTGYGVGHAMTMGRLAAEQAEAALRSQDFSASFLKNYDEKVSRKLGREIFLSHAITRLQKRIDLLEPLIYLMSRGQVLSNILSDRQLVSNLFNPRFYYQHWRGSS